VSPGSRPSSARGFLLERMRAVRTAARYAFRNHPELARKATSAYERRRRARARANGAEAQGETETEVVA
jgi:hypothetical protein